MFLYPTFFGARLTALISLIKSTRSGLCNNACKLATTFSNIPVNLLIDISILINIDLICSKSMFFIDCLSTAEFVLLGSSLAPKLILDLIVLAIEPSRFNFLSSAILVTYCIRKYGWGGFWNRLLLLDTNIICCTNIINE